MYAIIPACKVKLKITIRLVIYYNKLSEDRIFNA